VLFESLNETDINKSKFSGFQFIGIYYLHEILAIFADK